MYAFEKDLKCIFEQACNTENDQTLSVAGL